MRRRLVQSSFALLATILSLVASADARPDGERVKKARFSERNGQLLLTVGFREMFDATLRSQLRSGFATTVLMRIFLRQQGAGGTTLAASVRSIRALYDLWEGRFVVTAEEPGRIYTERFERIEDVVDRLTSFWRFPLVRTQRLRARQPYVVTGVVEVNPMSPEVLKEVRRWLRKPQRRQRGGTGESFFGSFVSVFVNDKVSRAEKIFKFRTQPFRRGDP